jgi:hypothetical protein
MQTEELLEEIKKLPIDERRYLVKQTLASFKFENDKKQMIDAAELLYNDYVNDKELTSFTDIDHDDFYEAK